MRGLRDLSVALQRERGRADGQAQPVELFALRPSIAQRPISTPIAGPP